MNQIIYDNKSYTIYKSDKYNEGKQNHHFIMIKK